MIAGAALAGAAAIAVALFLVTRGGGPSRAGNTGSPTGATADGIGNAPEALWRVDSQSQTAKATFGVQEAAPGDFAAGEGALWIAAGDGVTRYNARTGRTRKVLIHGTPYAISVGAGEVWTLVDPPGPDQSELVQIDPAVVRIARTTPLPSRAVALAVETGTAWILDSTGTLLRFGPVGDRIVDRTFVGTGASDLALGSGTVWVVNDANGALVRVEKASGTASAPLAVAKSVDAVATGEGAVWMVDTDDESVIAYHPVDHVLDDPIKVGKDPTAITTGNGAIWVADHLSIARIDPATRTVTLIDVGKPLLGVAGEHTLGAPQDQREIWALVENGP